MSLVSPISCNSCKVYIDEEEDKDQRKSLLKSHWDQMLDHRDLFGGEKVIALHLEPQVIFTFFNFIDKNEFFFSIMNIYEKKL